MAINAQLYIEKMSELKQEGTRVKQVAVNRQTIKRIMKEIADAVGDPALELTSEQKAALLNSQLGSTQALQTILNEAIAALTP